MIIIIIRTFLKPGYNVQIGVYKGYIATVYVSVDPNDIKTLIPVLEKYKCQYGEYLAAVVGEAGYGSYKNYCYCETHEIEGKLIIVDKKRRKEKQ